MSNCCNNAKPPKVYNLELTKFKGLDYQNNPVQVHPSRSPLAPNMTINQSGFPTKRKGYEKIIELTGLCINGIHVLVTSTGTKTIIHAGTKLYSWDKSTDTTAEILTGVNNARSVSFQKDNKLYILDGLKYRVYYLDGSTWTFKDVSELAYIPTTIISRNPEGGGTVFEAVNMIGAKRKNSFLGKDNVTTYKLDSVAIDATTVAARILDSNGDWQDKTEGTDFTVNRTLGEVNFTTSPNASPVTGMDNVEITFAKTNLETLGYINRCVTFDIYTIGTGEYIFLTGDSQRRNIDYRSYVNDPTYFPDNNYSIIGQDNTEIMTYIKIGNSQAIIKESNNQDVTIYLRTANTDSNGLAVFPITQGIATSGAISRYCTVNLNEDKLFLAEEGVLSLNSTLISSIMTQNRSFYVNPHLTKQTNLKNAVAITYKDKLYVAVNGHCYVADSRQKEFNKYANTESYQYEWMHWSNIPANVWHSDDNALYFGTTDGKIMRFFADDESGLASTFTDDGVAINAFWDTPYFDMNSITNYKTLKGLWLMLQPYARTSCKVFYKVKSRIAEEDSPVILHADIFSFSDLDFTRLTFNTDISPNVIFYRKKERKFMTIQFRFQNDLIEPFGLYKVQIQYLMLSRYRN